MFREMLALCRGTELFFGVVLAAGLFWTALGSVAAILAGRRRRTDGWGEKAGKFALSLWFANGLALVAQIIFARSAAASWSVGSEPDFLIAACVALIATGPVSFLCGIEFVLTLQSARAHRFARLYQAEAWGAVASGCALTLFLLGAVNPVVTGPAVGAVLGLVLIFGSRTARRTALVGTVVSAVAVAAAVAFDLDGQLHERRWAARFPGYILAAKEESRYGQLAVLRHPKVSQYSLYMDSALVETSPPPDASPTDASNAALFALSQHPNPRHVLLIGGGLGPLPEQLLAMKIERLDVVEIDPELLRLARRFGGPGKAEERLRVHLCDGRYFLKRADRRFDVILVNIPAPLSSLMNRFFTVEFFREAKNKMNATAVLITSVPAAANYPGESVGRLSGSILRTLETVFEEVLVAPGERHTFVAGTRKGVVTLDAALLGARIAARNILLPDVDADFRDALQDYYAARLENLIISNQVAKLRAWLDESGAAINTDANPIAYQYALLVWNQITSARLHTRDPGIDRGTNKLFQVLSRIEWTDVLWLPGFLAAVGLALLLLGRPWRPGGGARASASYALTLAAFATGMFGLAVEVVLLLSFQNVYGYAYAEVSMIVAAFMAGLAAGAHVGGKVRAHLGALFCLVTVMGLFCLALPAVIGVLPGILPTPILYPVFLFLVGFAGFLDGATFPPLVNAFRTVGVERPGGWIYASDLLGAGIGALTTGTLLVPVLGTSVTLKLLAAVLGAALIALPCALFAVRKKADWSVIYYLLKSHPKIL